MSLSESDCLGSNPNEAAKGCSAVMVWQMAVNHPGRKVQIGSIPITSTKFANVLK